MCQMEFENSNSKTNTFLNNMFFKVIFTAIECARFFLGLKCLFHFMMWLNTNLIL